MSPHLPPNPGRLLNRPLLPFPKRSPSPSSGPHPMRNPRSCNLPFRLQLPRLPLRLPPNGRTPWLLRCSARRRMPTSATATNSGSSCRFTATMPRRPSRRHRLFPNRLPLRPPTGSFRLRSVLQTSAVQEDPPSPRYSAAGSRRAVRRIWAGSVGGSGCSDRGGPGRNRRRRVRRGGSRRARLVCR